MLFGAALALDDNDYDDGGDEDEDEDEEQLVKVVEARFWQLRGAGRACCLAPGAQKSCIRSLAHGRGPMRAGIVQ
jgi:hypothetical protein